MIELVRQWVTGITCTALILAVAQSVVPDGVVKKVLGFTGGLLLMLVIGLPLLQMDGFALSDYLFEFELRLKQSETQLQEENEDMMKAIVAAQCEEYLQGQATDMGVNCQLEVRCAMSEGYPVPYVVHLNGEATEEQRRTLTLLIAQELGVPIERQYWNGGEG